jgi:hypothetical protein
MHVDSPAMPGAWLVSTPTSPNSPRKEGSKSQPVGPRFDRELDTVEVPAASDWFTSVRLAATLVQAVPMVATVKYVARRAPQLAEDAPESPKRLPRQKDVAARQDAIVVDLARWAAQGAAASAVPRALMEASHKQWLAQGFELVLGAGFFGMYQHAGVLRALAQAGLHSHVRGISGVSSGAIAGALYSALGPDAMTRSLLNLSLVDFLDLSVPKFLSEGALCEGRAIGQKIDREISVHGCHNLEDVPGPRLQVAVFDGALGRTVWHDRGPMGLRVAQSAALPVLFANQGQLDGGWVDHHGFTAMVPGERALSVRMNTGLSPDAMQKLVGRPEPLFNVSTDPEHKTVALRPEHKIDGSTFLFDIDFRKQKLRAIIEESQQLFTWWLMQPASDEVLKNSTVSL